MKKVYFIGIGGIGMSALARWFKFKGYAVAGYERTPSELTRELEAGGYRIAVKGPSEDVPSAAKAIDVFLSSR